MSAVDAARRLVGFRSVHPAVSVYLDLDPESSRYRAPASPRSTRCSTARTSVSRPMNPPSTTSVWRSGRTSTGSARTCSDDPPFGEPGRWACSEDLFEVVRLTRSVRGRAEIGDRPFVEPLIRASYERPWCVGLVSRREAWIHTNDERSIEKDVDEPPAAGCGGAPRPLARRALRPARARRGRSKASPGSRPSSRAICAPCASPQRAAGRGPAPRRSVRSPRGSMHYVWRAHPRILRPVPDGRRRRDRADRAPPRGGDRGRRASGRRGDRRHPLRYEDPGTFQGIAACLRF
jgi:hypothetical protein